MEMNAIQNNNKFNDSAYEMQSIVRSKVQKNTELIRQHFSKIVNEIERREGIETKFDYHPMNYILIKLSYDMGWRYCDMGSKL
jgi:hypothetical protein